MNPEADFPHLVALFQHADACHLIIHASGKIEYANPFWATTGLAKPGELTAASFEIVFPQAKDSITQTLEKGTAPFDGLVVTGKDRKEYLRGQFTRINATYLTFSGNIASLPDEFSGQFTNAILDNAEFFIAVVGVDSIVRTFNKKAEQLTGYRKEEVVGKLTNAQFHIPEELPELTKYFISEIRKTQQARPESAPYESAVSSRTWTFRRKDGSTFPMRLSLSPIMNNSHEIGGFMAIGEDMTEIEDTRIKLRQSRRRMASFLDALPIAIYILNEEGKPVYANDKSMQLLGKGILPEAHADTLGEVYSAYLEGTETLYPVEQMPVVRGLQGEEKYVDNMEIQRKNSRISLEVWGKPVFGEDGEVEFSIAAFIDISDRKKAQNRLEELLNSEKRLNQELGTFSQNLKKLHSTLTRPYDNFNQMASEILKSGTEVFHLPVGIFSKITGENYRIEAATHPEGALTEGMEFLLGNTYCDAVLSKKRTVSYAEFGKEPMALGHPVYQQMKLEAYLGTPVWVNGKIFGTLNFSSTLARETGFSQQEIELIELMAQAIGSAIEADMSRLALEDTARELKASNEELRKKNKELDEFAYVVSHDLKAPLRAISNLSHWLEEDLGENIPEEISNHLRLLRSRVMRMDGLINGILEYSRAGRKASTGKTVALQEVLEEVLDAAEVPPEFQISIPDDLPTVQGDPTEWYQIFGNLLGNAIKYHDRKDGKITVAWQHTDDHYTFSVTDDGPGIAPEYHDLIFGVFQRLEGRDEREGTGIGLSIVKKIIEANGGSISVISTPGKGASFVFTWPE